MSPYLFNLAMDFLAKWIIRLHDLDFIARPFPNCVTCLLYADDTLLFVKPVRNQLIKIRLLFDIFGALSGLKLNMLKSELAITSASPQLTQSMAALLQCKSATFPIQYLGLPLSQRGPRRSDFLPIIDRIRTALAGWKASLLSIGGRLVLTNAVLSSIPQYYMSVFLLPKWAILTIDQIRKRFLWHGHKEQSQQTRALYMVNWRLATRPRKIGGLGVRDIKIANQALLMKWMWQWCDHQQQQAWWKTATVMSRASDKPWNDPHGTPFWKGIAHIQPQFDSSVSYQIGNGASVQFWHDRWLDTALKWKFPNLYRQATNKQASIDQCTNENRWSISFPDLTQEAILEKNMLNACLQHINTPQSQRQDQVTWARCAGSFSVSSAYNFISQAPSPNSSLHKIWQIRAPLRVTVFAWLLLTNRLTTVDNLMRRGWNLPNMCSMCKKDAETVHHLFVQCVLARQIRDYILNALPSTTFLPTRFNAFDPTQMLIDSTESDNTRKWEIATCYILWRERCRRIFSNQAQSHMSIVREIKMELRNWFHIT